MRSDLQFSQTSRWLEWAREIQALAQIDFHFTKNHFQQERDVHLQEIAAEIIAEHSNLGVPEITEVFRKQTGYATPKVDVRAAIFRNDQLLLVRERADNGWTMPGGWADVGDLPSEAVEREVLEEAGFRVRAQRVVGIYDANRLVPLQVFHAYKIIFLCEIESGEAKSSSETSEVNFFSSEDLPTSLSSERTKPRHIHDAFRALKDPLAPTIFD
jgi:ADP-ribose pyrophosphatase YjhB (NUDIX family)